MGCQLAKFMEGESQEQKACFEKKGKLITMSDVEEWYVNCVSREGGCSPAKKKKLNSENNKNKVPIVVVFEDLEAFSRELLHDFILTSSFHSSKVNFVFILGVSTSWEEISSRLIDHSTVVKLLITKFNAPPPSRHLAIIFKKILLTEEVPFKLSGRCVQTLIDVFLRFDFSINNFIRSLKFCVIEHYRKQPLSVLCCMDLESSLLAVDQLKNNQLKQVAHLESVKKYLAKMNTSDAKKILTTAGLLRKETKKSVKEIYRYHEKYFLFLKCLHLLVKDIPSAPMGKQLREIFCLVHKTSATNCPSFKEASLYLKVSNKGTVIELLESLAEEIEKELEFIEKSEENEVCTPESLVIKIDNYLDTLTNDNNLDYYDSDEYENEDNQVEQLNKVKYTYQLQNRLRERRVVRATTKKLTRFEKLRNEIFTTITEYFQENLKPPTSMPLYEVFYFDSPQTIKERLLASPRLNIQTALSDPGCYLKMKELNESSMISSQLPDLSIVYKLHLESGELINIYDWMRAFHAIVTSEQQDDEENEEVSEENQARFFSAISELQFMGFIKPTKKKIDHAQRLTW